MWPAAAPPRRRANKRVPVVTWQVEDSAEAAEKARVRAEAETAAAKRALEGLQADDIAAPGARQDVEDAEQRLIAAAGAARAAHAAAERVTAAKARRAEELLEKTKAEVALARKQMAEAEAAAGAADEKAAAAAAELESAKAADPAGRHVAQTVGVRTAEAARSRAARRVEYAREVLERAEQLLRRLGGNPDEESPPGGAPSATDEAKASVAEVPAAAAPPAEESKAEHTPAVGAGKPVKSAAEVAAEVAAAKAEREVRLAKLEADRIAMSEKLADEKKRLHENLAEERARMAEAAAQRAAGDASSAAQLAEQRRAKAAAEQEALNAKLEALRQRRLALAGGGSQRSEAMASPLAASAALSSPAPRAIEEEDMESSIAAMRERLAEERRKMQEKIEARKAELAAARDAKAAERAAKEEEMRAKFVTDRRSSVAGGADPASSAGPMDDARAQMAARLEAERAELARKLAEERARYEAEKARLSSRPGGRSAAPQPGGPTHADIVSGMGPPAAAIAAGPPGGDAGSRQAALLDRMAALEAERTALARGRPPPAAQTGPLPAPYQPNMTEASAAALASSQVAKPFPTSNAFDASKALTSLSTALEQQRSEQNRYIAEERQAMRDMLELERQTMEKRLEEEKTELRRRMEERRAAQAKAEAEKLRMESQISDTLAAFQMQLAATQQMAMLMQQRSPPQASPAKQAGQPPAAAPAQPSLAEAVSAQLNQAAVAGGLSPSALQPYNDDDPPTQEEIVEYAVYLGMDPVADKDLLYIAEWALTAPLPEGWTEHLDQEGNEFYYNSVTGVSTYEHPLDEQYRAYYRNLKAQRGGGLPAGS